MKYLEIFLKISVSESNLETSNLDVSVELSEIGKMAQQFWSGIPNHFPFAELGEFVVMPNHVHGIIIINKRGNDHATAHTVETQNIASLQQPSQQTNYNGNKFGAQSQNLASIIRGYKIGVTKYARINNIDFAWQPRFHDHIIRDDKSFHTISAYIKNNPLNWNNDDFFLNGSVRMNT